MPLCRTARVQIDFQQIESAVTIEQEIKSEQLEAAILVLQMSAVLDDALDDVCGLLRVLSLYILVRQAEELIDHHD